MAPTITKEFFTITRKGERVKRLYLTVGGTPDELAHQHQEMLDEAEAEIRKGNMVTWENGVREWITREAVTIDHEEVFHTDGDRIKIRRERVTMTLDGERTEQLLGHSWVQYENFYAD